MPSHPHHSDKTANHDNNAQRHEISPACRNHWRNTELAAALDHAIPLLTETLVHHWSTGQGTRVRHILWSLYTCSHLVNLGEACSGLDRRLAEALATTIAARLILGPEVEPTLEEILRTSGEFARFDREADATPDHLPVIYPPAPADARKFREMADSLDHLDKRTK